MRQHKLPVSVVFGVISFNNLSIKFYDNQITDMILIKLCEIYEPRSPTAKNAVHAVQIAGSVFETKNP